MSTVAHFFIIIVAQKFVITWLTFSLTFTVARKYEKIRIKLIETIKEIHPAREELELSVIYNGPLVKTTF